MANNATPAIKPVETSLPGGSSETPPGVNAAETPPGVTDRVVVGGVVVGGVVVGGSTL